jgi:hypothetical protein
VIDGRISRRPVLVLEPEGEALLASEPIQALARAVSLYAGRLDRTLSRTPRSWTTTVAAARSPMRCPFGYDQTAMAATR